MNGGEPGGESFNPRLVVGVIAIGVVAFIALWALIALGPQLASGNNGGGHALSKGAPGYAGLVDLLERAGATVGLRRSGDGPDYGVDGHELLVLTPRHDSKAQDIARLIDAQRDHPVLIILPKWQALGRHPDKAGWVGAAMPIPASPDMLPEAIGKVDRIHGQPHARGTTASGIVGGRPLVLPLPGGRMQVIDSEALDTLIAHPHGGAILARSRDADSYVLSDPDLLDNLAFAKRDRARAAALLVDAIGEDANAGSIAFDLTLNGFGSQRSLLRFAFVPPFIGITLCLIAAFLLALWQAWARFGPAIKPGRAIAVSKAALIANSADLIRQAERELEGAGAFVHSQRTAIARRLHAPAGLDADETDAWIDRHLPKDGPRFAAIAQRLRRTRSTHELLNDAQALHDIRKELLRDG